MKEVMTKQNLLMYLQIYIKKLINLYKDILENVAIYIRQSTI